MRAARRLARRWCKVLVSNPEKGLAWGFADDGYGSLLGDVSDVDERIGGNTNDCCVADGELAERCLKGSEDCRVPKHIRSRGFSLSLQWGALDDCAVA